VCQPFRQRFRRPFDLWHAAGGTEVVRQFGRQIRVIFGFVRDPTMAISVNHALNLCENPSR
jgi:hypothetical protein